MDTIPNNIKHCFSFLTAGLDAVSVNRNVMLQNRECEVISTGSLLPGGGGLHGLALFL